MLTRKISANELQTSGSSIALIEGDLLQPEKIHNEIVFNVAKNEDLTLSSKSHDLESYSPVAGGVQLDCPKKEIDTNLASGYRHDGVHLAA